MLGGLLDEVLVGGQLGGAQDQRGVGRGVRRPVLLDGYTGGLLGGLPAVHSKSPVSATIVVSLLSWSSCDLVINCCEGPWPGPSVPVCMCVGMGDL